MEYHLRPFLPWITLFSMALIVPIAANAEHPKACDLNGKSSAGVFSGSILLYGRKHRPEPSHRLELLDPISLQLQLFSLFEKSIPATGRVSPNGTKLATSLISERDGVTSSDVVIIDANNCRTTIARNAEVVAWSPDSERILLRRGNKYNWENVIISVADGSSEILPLPKTDTVTDWSRDGTTLCVMAGRPERVFELRPVHFYPRRQLYLYHLKTGAADEPFTDAEDDCIKGMFSHDGSTLAYSRRIYDAGRPVELCEITHLSSGKSSTLINFTQLGVRPNGSPAWSGDGRQVVWQVVRENGNGNLSFELWFMLTDGSPRRTLVAKDLSLDFFRVLDWR